MDWTEAVEVNMTKDWKCGEALHLAPLVTRPEKETRQNNPNTTVVQLQITTFV